MSRPVFNIYPSLLDKFQDYLDAGMAVEDPWNKVSESSLDKYPGLEVGDYIKTEDEIADALEQELLDAINRVPHEPIEAADKGTCFNEILDCLILHTASTRDDVKVSKWFRDPEGTAVDGIKAEIDGFSFVFDKYLCWDAAEELKGACAQHLCEGLLETKYGTVRLYGYADYILQDRVIDVKTTSMYGFGKYERKWQKHVYPYCLVQSGEMDCVKSFIYSVYVLNKREPFVAQHYLEEYTYNHERTTEVLRAHVERFIEWLDKHREQITDKKIFNNVPDQQQSA